MKRCLKCKKRFLQLDIHHKNKVHNDNRKKNLMLLCKKCHGLIHGGKNKRYRVLLEKDKNKHRLISTKELKKCKNKTLSMNVSFEFKEFLDNYALKLEDYLWNEVKLSYAVLTRILVRKINEKNIKI